MNQTRGSILIVSLWVVAILFLLAVGLAYRIGLELRMARYTQERLKLFYIAKGGMERAIAFLVEDLSLSSIDTLQEGWSHTPSLFQSAQIGEGTFTLHYSFQEGEEERMRYGMKDEESRIPLNHASHEVLMRVPGMEESLALSIRAWRGDKDLAPEMLAREDTYYASLERPYPRKGKPFDTLEELLLVKEMTPSLYETMKGLFTIYGSGKMNLNTAPPEALILLGLDETIARHLAEARRGEDGKEGTEDDALFQEVSDLVSLEWNQRLRLDQDQQLSLTNFLTAHQDLLSVQSSAFRIALTARLREGGPARKEVVAVVSRTEEKGAVHYWHEE